MSGINEVIYTIPLTCIRNQSALLAFTLPQKWKPGAGLSIVATHVDSPNLRVCGATCQHLTALTVYDYNDRSVRCPRRPSTVIFKSASRLTAVEFGIPGSIVTSHSPVGSCWQTRTEASPQSSSRSIGRYSAFPPWLFIVSLGDMETVRTMF